MGDGIVPLTAQRVAERFRHAVKFLPFGPEHPEYGPPTQMAVFRRKEGEHGRFP